MSEVSLTASEAMELRKECEQQIELKNCMERLLVNQDFKKVFMEDYSEKQAKRIVHLLAEPSFVLCGKEKREDYRLDINEQMIGIARFNAYIRLLFTIAERAENTLKQLNNAEIIAE